MRTLKKILLSIVLVLLVSIQCCYSYTSETLDYGNCKIYYLPDETGNSTTYNQVEVCSSDFPTINQQVILDKDNPLFVLPLYNFSANINPEVYVEAQKIREDINYLNSSLDELKTEMGGVSDSSKENVDALNSIVNKNYGDLLGKLDNESLGYNERLNALENKLRRNSGGINWSLVGSVVVFICMIVIWIVYKLGYFSKIITKEITWGTAEPPKKEKPAKKQERKWKKKENQ